MTTLAEVQLKRQLRQTPSTAEKELIATRIIAVRAVEYIDGLRLFPVGKKEVQKIVALVTPCNVPEIQRVIKEAEEEEHNE